MIGAKKKRVVPFPPLKNSIADLTKEKERKKERTTTTTKTNTTTKRKKKDPRARRKKATRTFPARFSPRAISPRRSCSASRNRCRTSPLKSLDFLSCSRRLVWTARISSKMSPRREREARRRRTESETKKRVRGSRRRATLCFFFCCCCSFCSLAGGARRVVKWRLGRTNLSGKSKVFRVFHKP
jgi:hypothetical protein